MAVVTEAQVVANELERVSPKVPTLFDRDDVFYSTIEKRNVEVVSNRDMRIPLELEPGGNFGHYDPDGGDLGRGDGPKFDKAVINTVHFKMGVEWTKKSEWATDDQRKAVLNTFRHLLAKSMAEFRRQVDSACMTGGNGVIGTGTTAAAGTIVTPSDKFTIAATDPYGVRLMRKNQTVGIYDTTLATKRGEGKVVFYDLENRIVEVQSLGGGVTPGVTTGDKLVLSGLTANPVGLLGVPYHHSNASSGTWLGFNRANVPEIRANAVNASSSALSLPFARLALNKIGNRVGIDQMAKVTAWMHPCQKQAYEELGQMVSIIQKQPKSEALDMYFGDNLQMAGAPIRTSFSWDKTRIDFVNTDIWGRAELKPAGFYDVDGQKIFPIRGASGGLAASMIFYIVASFNLFINNPALASYIYGLTIPSGY
jgi:hypothetical protein